MAKLGFIVKGDNHEHKSWDLTLKLCEIAQSSGLEVHIFAMMNGIYYMLQPKEKKDEPSPLRIRVEKIMDKGAKISVFGISAQERGFEGTKPFIDGVKVVSMADLANMVGTCDRVIIV